MIWFKSLYAVPTVKFLSRWMTHTSSFVGWLKFRLIPLLSKYLLCRSTGLDYTLSAHRLETYDAHIRLVVEPSPSHARGLGCGLPNS
jgi:hypothetical protein